MFVQLPTCKKNDESTNDPIKIRNVKQTKQKNTSKPIKKAIKFYLLPSINDLMWLISHQFFL